MTEQKTFAELLNQQGEHAVFSASSVSRWKNCPGSAYLNAILPDETSVFAEEGTKAHSIAEECIKAFQSGKEEPNYEGEELTIRNELEPYLNRVKALMDEKGAVVFSEIRVDYSEYAPKGFGTSDVIMIAGDELYIIDLKFGRGVPVSAINNGQMRLYALGAIKMFGKLYPIKNIITRIDQPRIHNFSEEVISVEELLEWGETVIKPAAERCMTNPTEYIAGSHCQFCKAAGKCPARAEKELALEEVKNTLPDVNLLTPEQISDVLQKGKDLSSWLEKVQEYALEQALTGKAIPGFKVVEGRSLRKYDDEAKIKETLVLEGWKESDITRLMTISELEKVVGKDTMVDLTDKGMIIKPEGKPTLVPESDKRKAMEIKEDLIALLLERGGTYE